MALQDTKGTTCLEENWNCVKIQLTLVPDKNLDDALVDWDDLDDDGGNSVHRSDHGLTPREVEVAFFDELTTFDVSDSSGRPIAFGTTNTGRFIAIVFEERQPGRPVNCPPHNGL